LETGDGQRLSCRYERSVFLFSRLLKKEGKKKTPIVLIALQRRWQRFFELLEVAKKIGKKERRRLAY
jgi:hypothetical protein